MGNSALRIFRFFHRRFPTPKIATINFVRINAIALAAPNGVQREHNQSQADWFPCPGRFSGVAAVPQSDSVFPPGKLCAPPSEKVVAVELAEFLETLAIAPSPKATIVEGSSKLCAS